MAGQALMCVWQAVAAADPKHKGPAPASRVRHLTMQIAMKSDDFRYTESAFQTTFPGDTIDFESYRVYVTERLVSKTMQQQAAEAIIEDNCWEACAPAYAALCDEHPQLSQADYRKLWQMFNRICVPGSCPPVLEVADMDWWANKLAAPLRKMWVDLPTDAAPLSFPRAAEILGVAVFSADVAGEAPQSVEQLHSWIVREVSMTGWLYKRTRKQSNNWSTWRRRYSVLTPGQIKYYTSVQQREKEYKGSVSVNSFSRLESLNPYKGLIHTYPNRFRISNQPVIELEVSALFKHEKAAWMSAITEVIDAAKAGTTPVQAVLADRLSQHTRGKPRQTIDQAVAKLKSKRLSKIPDTLDLEEAKRIPAKPASKSSIKTGFKEEKSNSTDVESGSDEESFDNNTYMFEKSKVREVFDRIDSDKNGLLSEREFDEFMRILVGRSGTGDDAGYGLYLPIFEELVGPGDRVVDFPAFYTYFTELVLDQTPSSSGKAALKAEFLGADTKGVGAVDFKDLAEFVWDRRRSFRYRKLISTLDASPAKRESWCPILTTFIQLQYSGDGGFGHDFLQANELDQQLPDTQMNEQMDTLAERIALQWDAFTTELSLRSTEAQRIAARFNLVDVACWFPTRGKQQQEQLSLLAIDAARWESDIDMTQLVLPAGSDLTVPAVNATDALLRYFGCRLADSFHEQVALFYEHRIENMSYSNETLMDLGQHMAGGPSLNKSSQSRFDCPLSDSSGYLIIARWEGDEETLEVAAFRVPSNHSVYIPAGTMYSLDYANGSWRTLKSPSAVTDEHAQLKRQFTDANTVDLENVRFSIN